MGRTGRRLTLVVALAAAIGWFVWALRPAPLVVEVARATRGELLLTIDEEGEMRARDRYLVAAPVAGRLARIGLRDGDAVAVGDVVAEIWPLPLSAREREEQTARVAAATAAVTEAEARLARAAVDHRQAQRERVRVDELVARRYVSPQAAEQLRSDEAAKGNELAAARARVGVAQADLAAARATLLALAAAADGAHRVPVVSPVAGRVLRIVDRSERVVAAGAPLANLGDATRLEAVVDLLSQDAVRVRPGMPMLIEGWGGEGALTAIVRTVEPFAFTKVSALGVEEQRVNVVADLADAPASLGDGYRFEGRIVVERCEAVLKVPASALARNGDGWQLFVVDGGVARLRGVRVGLRNAAEAQIIEGLAEGASVVRHPGNALADGRRVAVR